MARLVEIAGARVAGGADLRPRARRAGAAWPAGGARGAVTQQSRPASARGFSDSPLPGAACSRPGRGTCYGRLSRWAQDPGYAAPRRKPARVTGWIGGLRLRILGETPLHQVTERQLVPSAHSY